MDLADHLGAIWRRRYRVVLLALVVAALVFARSSSIEETYSSSAVVGVEFRGTEADEQRVAFVAATLAELAGTDPVLTQALEAAELDLDVDEARLRSTVEAGATAGFLQVAVTGPTAAEAAALSGGLATALVEAVGEREAERLAAELEPLDARIATVLAEIEAATPPAAEPDDPPVTTPPALAALQGEYEVLVTQRAQVVAASTAIAQVVQAADTPDGPATPTPARDAVLGFLVALVVNAELWVVVDALSGRFGGTADQVARATGLPVLARVAAGRGGKATEGLRALRTSLLFLSTDGRVRSLAVVGVDRGVGKSFIAAGLAQATAALGVQVVLIDADLRAPTVHRRLGIPREPGFTDLDRGLGVAEVLVPAPDEPSLRLIPAGRTTADPAGVVGSSLRPVVEAVEAVLVVVDTPAASASADAAAAAAQCDVAIVVVDPSVTRRKPVIELVESLRRVGANPVGIVLNRVDAGPEYGE